jgi:hypothetical protein
VSYDQLWCQQQQGDSQQSSSTRLLTHTHPSLYSGVNKIIHLSEASAASPDALPSPAPLNLCCSISSDGSLIGSAYPLQKKSKKKVDTVQFFRLQEVTMAEEQQQQQGQEGVIVRYAEIIISDQLGEVKPDLSTRVSPPPVALIGLHSTELAGHRRHYPAQLMPTGFHLLAYGGQAGLVRVHLLHPSCFHPRIQLFQERGKSTKS